MIPESGADEVALFKSYANLQHIDPELAKPMLAEAKEILDSLGVPFFLRQGTCLGAVRDQAFIPWDDDIDLGSVIGLNGLTEDMLDPVFDAFRDRGYFVNVDGNDRWIAAGMMKSSTRVDLTFFHIIDNHIFHFPFIWIPARLFANLKEIEFMGGKYPVPNPPEEYLQTKYGPNWITPKQDYERDVVNQVEKPPRVTVPPSREQPTTKIRILDQLGKSVRGATVSVVGLADTVTDENGYAEFGLPYKDFYAVVINFDDHEEILYQELMSQGALYVYTPDASTSNGRLMALTEEREAFP
ncbi:MAG: LicD family protein [Chloroflexi bacterium]|nr:LicD family protein [Chloroflexota bacterium]